MHTLNLSHITKQFRKNIVVNDVSLNMRSGRIYGLTGSNGSGKTVLMKMMIGLMRPTKGEILYDQKKLKSDFDFLPSVGFVIETPGFFDELTGFDNLKILADLNKKIDATVISRWMERFELPVDNKPVKDYSLGMNQRLGIIQALMEDPEVLILDEITNSLDEDGIQLVHTVLKEEKDKGKIIVVSSHSRYDIDALCDEVYRFKEGRLYRESKTE